MMVFQMIYELRDLILQESQSFLVLMCIDKTNCRGISKCREHISFTYIFLVMFRTFDALFFTILSRRLIVFSACNLDASWFRNSAPRSNI
ncbi:hypothetical protein AR158_c692L [Paramecium bursaria Chlorella virus AR158]|uniref:hypothetical protein n=1 Tax=Paramecium bursaria Chlorella virus AR158 TaxID=380598 RepID=UPI00015AA860|nr:hypothetical protein AR158_c692L [Paramecium bursaria Chlorella virus AR158]ABU44237.1 hypothetical protein AR158_c692L [Paramecium bursaria Chlorella virus AR158]